MKYSVFKETMKTMIRDYLPEEYRDAEVKLEMIKKTNGYREALMIQKKDAMDPVPALYTDDMYREYQKTKSLDKTMRYAADYYMNGIRIGAEMAEQMLRYGMKDDIIMQLVNTRMNQAMIEDSPHREFLDLTVLYRHCMPLPDGSFNLATVSLKEMDDLGLSEPELYELAKKNSRKLLPAVIDRLDTNVFAVTNKKGLAGASVVLYSDRLKKISKDIQDDLYLIPSSIHEMMVLPATNVDPVGLRMMLLEANRVVLETGEVLSDQIYYYDRMQGNISLACQENVKQIS